MIIQIHNANTKLDKEIISDNTERSPEREITRTHLQGQQQLYLHESPSPTQAGVVVTGVVALVVVIGGAGVLVTGGVALVVVEGASTHL